MSDWVVTGGAGFIGSNLVHRLVAEGERVIVVDDLSYGDAERLPPEAELQVTDITDFPALEKAIGQSRPKGIFHLGAQSMITVSLTDPQRDCIVNVMGTLNVLQVARERRAPVVFTSTGGALYGDGAPIPSPEDSTPAPVSPYGASKWAAEAYVRTWALTDSLPHAICRLANVYGPRQSPHGEAGVVAILTYALWKQREPVLYGQGQAIRDYVEVGDLADALWRAAGVEGIFNIASGRETSVLQIFELLSEAAVVRVEPRLAPLRDGELQRCCLDPARAERELGWRARVSLEEGVPKTYAALVEEYESAEG